MIRSLVVVALFSATCSLYTRGAEPEASGGTWSWVQKFDSEGKQDDTATALALVQDSIWVGGRFADRQYIQKLSLDGKTVGDRVFLNVSGDGVNDLVAGSTGELYGVAEIQTSPQSGFRPAYYFKRRADGTFADVRLATTEPSGNKGYADAWGIDRSGKAVYVVGYFRPSDHAANKQAFFGTNSLSLSNLPTASFSDNSYKGFLVKIDADTDKVIWAKYLDCESAEAVRVDLQERVFVAGRGNGADGAGFVACYRGQDGAQLWSTSTITAVNSLALDVENSLWVSNAGDDSNAPHLQRFECGTGELLKDLQLLVPPYNESPYYLIAIAAHPSGGIVALSHVNSQSGFCISRLDSQGNELWTDGASASGGLPSSGIWSKMIVDENGNVYSAFSVSSGNCYNNFKFSDVLFGGFPQAFPFASDDDSSAGFVARLSPYFEVDLSSYFTPGGGNGLPAGLPYEAHVFGPYDEDKYIYSPAAKPVSVNDVFYFDNQPVDDTGYGHFLFSGKTTLLGHLTKGSTFKVNVYNLGGDYGCSGTLRISSARIAGMPTITAGTHDATAWINAPFSREILADKSPTSFGAVGLPDGLYINASTGAISGTPSANSGGRTYPVSISAINEEGVSYANLILRVYGAPTITNLHPVRGVPGEILQIFGSGLTGASAVTFNGTPASTPSVADNCITVQVPVGATTGKVSVTTPAGTVSSQNIFTLLPPTPSPTPSPTPTPTASPTPTPTAPPTPPPIADSTAPTLSLTVPSSPSVSTRAQRYTLRGNVSDNVLPVSVQFRIRQPGRRTYGPWSAASLAAGNDASKAWTFSVALSRRASWAVQIRALDAAGNLSAIRSVTIMRR